MNERDIITIAREKLCGTHLCLHINGLFSGISDFCLFKIKDIAPICDYSREGAPSTCDFYLIGEDNKNGNKWEKVTYYTLSQLVKQGEDPEYKEDRSSRSRLYISEVILPKLMTKANDLFELAKGKYLYKNDLCLGAIYVVRLHTNKEHIRINYNSFTKGEDYGTIIFQPEEAENICRGETIEHNHSKYKIAD